MTDTEILEKAIQKAIDGGWKYPDHSLVVFLLDDGVTLTTDYTKLMRAVETIIYDRQFAKAVWGDGSEVKVPELPEIGGTFIHILDSNPREASKAYLWHLQQMVIADDPIKYLEKNAL